MSNDDLSVRSLVCLRARSRDLCSPCGDYLETNSAGAGAAGGNIVFAGRVIPTARFFAFLGGHAACVCVSGEAEKNGLRLQILREIKIRAPANNHSLAFYLRSL